MQIAKLPKAQFPNLKHRGNAMTLSKDWIVGAFIRCVSPSSLCGWAWYRGEEAVLGNHTLQKKKKTPDL